MNVHCNRRRFLQAAGTGTLAGWLGRLALYARHQQPPKSAILLWMGGGPSHLDTFDLKPEAPDHIRGEFRPIATAVPGIYISEHFPRLARLAQHVAILRSMSTAESDHQLASYHLHTGYPKRAAGIAFPSLGSIVARELARRDIPIPNFVCVGTGPRGWTRAGFLGPECQPLDITQPERGLDFVEPVTDPASFARRHELLKQFNTQFQIRYQSDAAAAHSAAIDQAVRLMTSEQKQAFDLWREPQAVRERYGLGSFGQSCLLARRLVEIGIPFVEVIMGDGMAWDTHRDNFPRTKALSLEADMAMAALIGDLNQRGLLDTTLVIWMGEFGRSPMTTRDGGRNHWATAWSCLLAGGGVRGGQVVGKTNRHASEVVERPISVTDFLATVCTILGIDYTRQNRPPAIQRPIPIVDTSKEIKIVSELL